MSDTVIKKIVRDVVREEIKPVENSVAELNRKFDSLENKSDRKFDIFLEKLEKYFFDFRSDMAKIKDEIVAEIEKFREENTIVELKGQHQRIVNLEDEVEKIQFIHQKYPHQTLVA